MKIPWRQIILLAVVSALSLGGYLIVSHSIYRIGFPLDDAWIHQTYARNLAKTGEWAFIPGQPSGGSTGPLWGVLLSLGYVLRLGPYVWAFLLGWFLLFGMGILGVFAHQLIAPATKQFAIWSGVLLTLEWHLVWAAGSGMETLAYTLVVTLVLILLMRKIESYAGWLGIGLIIGLSIWLRPDGITLLGPALFVILFSQSHWQKKIKTASVLILGFIILFAPYLGFNQILSGAWWPNTFFAKQAEYAADRENLPFIVRLVREFTLPLVGVGVVLLPGFLIKSYRILQQRNWRETAAAIWALGYLVLYAMRLPVIYQHGRYVIPMMPTFFILGFAGSCEWIRSDAVSTLRRILSRTWLIVIPLVLLVFWGRGAIAYAKDVAVIESEMVVTAHWVAVNTPQDALIAAHDIGAFGYFGGRKLLDLAGLISPDVIPFIRDENRLKDYLDSQGAEYLVTFPKWYPTLVSRAPLIFQTTGKFSPSLGGENMAVYQWSSP